MPRKIQHPKSVTELVINEIKKFIVTNKLQPGDKLPTEKEMAAMFGVGRSSVREAIQTLQGLGLVKVVQGRGTFLTDASLTVLKDQLAFTLGCGTTRVSDLTEARRILEVAAVKLAASRATEEQLQEMATIIEEMRYADSQEEILRKGIKFHYAIIRAAQNPLITKMLDAIWGVIYETLPALSAVRKPWKNPLPITNRFRVHCQRRRRRSRAGNGTTPASPGKASNGICRLGRAALCEIPALRP